MSSRVFGLGIVCLTALWIGELPVAAQTDTERGWLDVNFGVAVPAEEEFAMAASGILYREVATWRAGYALSRGASFDVGGGYMFTRLLGIGLSLSGTAHEDPAAAAIRIPHPLYAGAHATDADVTSDTLTRAEGGLHVQGVVNAVSTDRVRLRFFGGPSFLRAEQDAISDIRYDQQYGLFTPANRVDITNYVRRKVETSGWGFHAGADIGVFFTRVIGIGAVVRVSRASLDVENTLAATLGAGETVEIEAGGLQVGGGLRIRF